ncbi:MULTISPECIES: hypothetical protein [unclassified Fusibacter]|uniref:hypothetical protein n=1 Tax=unclassified Fusibacter TaxID=2624464 RepID=UPI0010135167|nr:MULTISPECIES: hypothetical protein [unclassified Fusibacter]MCK8059720.1 hypothetical protein [Fusibacter sp. A2]NPE21521.1 hypothetical protein [Fusibacter sp. A1]RXV61931.1 hypothetical protein DWB64_06740 [Fusibacter sp. A1]
MSYRIGSLNLLKSYRTEEQGREFYGFIYDLIADEGLDIIAFQEAKNRIVIDGILRNLPSYWTGTHVYGSEFSFIWNSNRIVECSRNSEPRIYSDYRSSDRMKRDPLYGRFSPRYLDSSNEFRLINIHVEHGGNDSLDSIIRRKKECELAKGVIHQKIDTHRYGNFKRAFTAILGDYNIDSALCNSIEPQNIHTFQDEKTTLKKSDPGYASNYDHFSFNVLKNSSVPYTISRIDAVNHYFFGDYKKYRENVSDHVPVKIEVF